MSQLNKATIARAHRFPVPLSDAAIACRENAVMLRYDGKEIHGESMVFVVLPVADLAKLPNGGLNITEADIDGETAFFRETSNGVALYLESDTHADRLASLRDMALNGVVALLDCIGDLKLMGAPDNLQAPKLAAYEENDFAEVSPVAGLMLLQELTSEIEKARRADEDSSISPGL